MSYSFVLLFCLLCTFYTSYSADEKLYLIRHQTSRLVLGLGDNGLVQLQLFNDDTTQFWTLECATPPTVTITNKDNG